MNMDPKEIEALLNSTPDIPQNAPLISELVRMLEASRIVKFPFTYHAEFYTAGANSNLAAGATATVNVQIDAGAPFLIVSQSFFANTANGAITVSTMPAPNVVVLITDTGSTRTLMDTAIPIPAIFGTGQFPYVLPEPKLMQANSQLSVQATNRDAAAGYNFYLCFNGFKLFTL